MTSDGLIPRWQVCKALILRELLKDKTSLHVIATNLLLGGEFHKDKFNNNTYIVQFNC